MSATQNPPSKAKPFTSNLSKLELADIFLSLACKGYKKKKTKLHNQPIDDQWAQDQIQASKIV